MDLDPTWSRGDCLTPVFGAPALNETHPYHTHLGQAIDSLEALVDRLRQQLRKFLVIEDLQVAPGGNFAHCRRMPPVASITVWTLHEDAAIAEALGEHLPADIIESHAFSNMAARRLYSWDAIDVREDSETEAIGTRRVGETVNGDTRSSSVEGFSDTVVHFVVRYAAPVLWFLILNWLSV